MTDRRRSWMPELALLTAIVMLAGVLRFAYLPARGLIYWDEGKFALEGVRLETLLQALVGVHSYLLAGKAVGTAKPAHALLIGIAYLLLGVHDYSAAMMNAFASTAGVVVTYFIGRRLVDNTTALVSALLLAVSEYDVIYARSALSESDANLILLLAVLVWLLTATKRERDRWSPRLDSIAGVLIASCLLGVAFTVNYRIAVYTAAFLGVDWTWILIRGAIERQTSSVLPLLSRRISLCLAGFALAPIAWEVIGVVVQSHGIDLFHAELTAQSQSYFQEAAYQLHGGKQSAVLFNPALYLEWWVVRQGWPVSLVLGVALAMATRRRSYTWLLPAALVLLPYAIYIFAPFAVPRNLVASLPFASLLCARAITTVAGSLRRVSGVAVLACALALGLLGGIMSWRLTAERSGFASAARYVEKNAGGKALTSSEIMVFYLRGNGQYCLAPALPYHRSSLAAYEGEGYRFAVVDRHHGSPMVNLIERHSPRIAAFPALGSLSIGESPISSENSNPPRNDSRTEYVDVYRLVSLPGRRAGARPCQRDRVT